MACWFLLPHLAKQPQAAFLASHAVPLRVMGGWVRALEFYAPLLLLVPGARNTRCRLYAIVAFVALHTGFAIFMELGHFPFTCVALWLPVIPSYFWEWAADAVRQPALAAPDAIALGRRGVRGGVRGAGGGGGGRRVRFSWAAQLSATVLAVVILNYNVSGFDKEIEFPVSHNLIGKFNRTQPPIAQRWKQLQPVVTSLHLGQKWNMFCPQPTTKVAGWFVAKSQFRNGRIVDLLNPRNDTYLSPPWGGVGAQGHGKKWKKLFERVLRWKNVRDGLKLGMCRYFCRVHNELLHYRTDDPNALVKIELMYQRENDKGSLHSPPKSERLWRHFCFKKDIPPKKGKKKK